MAKTIEIPDSLYEQLAERAAAAGMAMGEYVLRELERPGRMKPGELLAYLMRSRRCRRPSPASPWPCSSALPWSTATRVWPGAPATRRWSS
jgi:hypothetical protein